MKKLLSFCALAVVVALSSCDKDDENQTSTQLSKTEAKTEINSFNASATEDLQDLASSEGLHAMTDLSNLASVDDPFGGRTKTDRKKVKAFLREKGSTFRKIVDKNFSTAGRQTEEGFDFAAHAGVYAWNPALGTEGEFELVGESNIIEIQFPTEGSLTNNGELHLNAYEEVSIYDEEMGDYFFQPSHIDADLSVDGAEVASLEFEATWDELGFPLTADVTATVVPFTATVSFDVSAADKNSLSASLKKNSETLFATSVTVEYSGSTKSEEDLETISGFVQVSNLKLEGTIDAAGINAEQDEVDLNEYVSLTLYANDKKAGVIVFETEMVDGFEETVAYIEYNDGTKEKLEDVVQPVIDEFENMVDDLEGEG